MAKKKSTPKSAASSSSKKRTATPKTPSKTSRAKALERFRPDLVSSETFVSNKAIFLSPASNPHHDEGGELPVHYGDNKIVLLVRDPWWIFAYWEYTQTTLEKVVRALREAGQEWGAMVLRVYSLDEGSRFFDIDVPQYAERWYIDVGKPGHRWKADLGVRSKTGRFFSMLSSNEVRTPAFGISDVIDEEWYIPDELYKKFIREYKESHYSSSILYEYWKRMLEGGASSHIHSKMGSE